MAKTVLTVGKRINGESDPCHYILDGEYVHTGKCLDEFLTEQWHANGHEGPADDHDLAGMWELLVQEGCWTPFSKADIDALGNDYNDLECKMCKGGIWLPN